MGRLRIQDLQSIEASPTSPAALRGKIAEIVLNSTHAEVTVESFDPETGDYRVVLHGTLDGETTRHSGS